MAAGPSGWPPGCPDGQTPDVDIRTIEGTQAFVVIDLPQADRALGVVRSARKILRDGAVLLARTETYRLAALELPAGGASVGISIGDGDRDEVVASAVAGLVPDAEAGRLLLDPAKGVDEDDLRPLRDVDPRPDALWAHGTALAGASAAGAGGAALGGWEGRTIALERTDPVSVAFAGAAQAAGARLVAVGTGSGSVALAEGTAAADLTGDVAGLGTADERPIWAVAADVVAVGSKPGVVDHDVAADLAAGVLVPTGPVPVTARGLAVARGGGCAVLPDFVTLGGPAQALLADADETGVDDLLRRAADDAAGLIAGVLDHPEGPLLGACERAEAFLATWVDELPFGRPLA